MIITAGRQGEQLCWSITSRANAAASGDTDDGRHRPI